MHNDIDRDLYEILGIDRDVSQADIKNAYRKKAREFHPDVAQNDPDAEYKFKEVTFAYEVLSDPEKKQQYDAFGLNGLRGGMGVDFSNFTTFSDLIEMFFGNTFGDTFGRRRDVRAGKRGRDIETVVKISLADVASGVEKEMEIRHLAICDECGGTGLLPGTKTKICDRCKGSGEITSKQRNIFGTFVRTAICPLCNGMGEVIKDPCISCNGEGRRYINEMLKISIPPGVERGDHLRVNGKGESGIRGGRSGDLYVTIDIKPEPTLQREGRNLFTEVAVSMIEAALGVEITLPTFNGEYNLKIAPGTQPGEMIRIKGKGLPPRGGGRKGDMLIKVNVSVPRKLTTKQKQILESFTDSKDKKAVT